jgi:ribonuclease E
MTMRMLIDARHREETRVAVVTGNRIEEFDFESEEHKQLKGNIYLAKVTRVEPSLQAAFVEYGGNRHGFLAFSEIHPDYYQIPREDREALLREEAEHAAEEAALRGELDDDDDDDMQDGAADYDGRGEGDFDDQDDHDAGGNESDGSDEDGESAGESGDANGRGRGGRRGSGGRNAEQADEVRRKRMALRRRYKIQDVIRRRQVLLVQVVKEERGNKGAALTTYLSLAGRYCVLMPNTSHGGGISRKISNTADRKRLKSIIADMDLPNTMGCIVRTAGLSRTKTEIRRDFDYLARLWDEIRENTLKASAPALIHNDSDLIKRAIRDIYHRDIDEVLIEGEDGYRAAKDFMKLLMPSHARRVKPYADAVSLFQRYGVEDQLAAMYNPVVQLKSGGYLVINPTEALVSIDINSGRSTREHNIEQTATATNLEAAREIARQLRLRDMAGLVVIDFIDMEHNSNIRKVEKAMKEALKDDRARIQVGRISSFGLMEMSRQRLRTGVLEASTRACPHCEGTGLVRTASSAGLSALRMLEEEAARGRGSLITLRASQEAAFYVLNHKRRELGEIEARYGVIIAILPDGEVEGARMSVEASGPRPVQTITYAPIVDEVQPEDDNWDEDEQDEDEESEGADAESGRQNREGSAAREDRDGNRRRRRRRRGRRGPREDGDQVAGSDDAPEGEAVDGDDQGDEAARDSADRPAADGENENGEARRSRRGRRGGRRRRGGAREDRDGDAPQMVETAEAGMDANDQPVAVEAAASGDDAGTQAESDAPRTRRRPRARKGDAVAAVAPELASEPVSPAEPIAEAAEVLDAPAKPKRASRRKAVATDPVEAAPVAAPEAVAEAPAKPKRASRASKAAPPAATDEPLLLVDPIAPAPAEPVAGAAKPTEDQSETESDGSPRRGWWQRTFGA